MKLKLTQNEQNFLQSGKELWAIRQCAEGWQAVKIRQSGEFIASTCKNKEDAENTAIASLNLSENRDQLGFHHSIQPRAGWPTHFFLNA